MCDSLIFKNKNYTLFAKNSDREPNEAQAIQYIPRIKTVAKKVTCTYINIPQVLETFEVILSKPFQMWGAEMGVNEFGVTICNEAVFTKIREAKKNTGLTGMDLIRLALERSTTSTEALQTICELVETYGQDACGGYQNKNFFYHSSFLIADAEKAYKLETVGKHWVFQEIKEFDSISNGLTILNEYDGISKNAIAFAQQKKWIKKDADFSFRDVYSDKLYTRFSQCKIRRSTTYQALDDKKEFSIQNAINVLQSHPSEKQFNPAKCTAKSVCMHPTGMLNPSQTNGSMIVRLEKNNSPKIWVTGTSMPCLSIYKPLLLGKQTNIGVLPSAKLDDSLWWQAEKAHRTICKDYPRGKVIHQEVFQDFQEKIFNDEYDPQEVWTLYREKIKLLNKELEIAHLAQKSKNIFYIYNWNKWNKRAKIN